MVDVISSCNKSVIDRLVDAIGRGKKDSRAKALRLFRRMAITSSTTTGLITLICHSTHISTLTTPSIITRRKITASQRKSRPSLIHSYRVFSRSNLRLRLIKPIGRVSAEVAELASVLNEIKDSLAKAPSTEAEKTRAKDLVSKFKDRVDDCSRLNAIYTLGSGAIETFQKILIGGVLA